MGYPNRDNRGGDRRGGGGGGSSYGRRDFGAPRSYDRPQMHSATCANCGKACEVPFKPTGDRPVYCKECFNTMGGRSESRNNYDRNSNDSYSKPQSQPQPQQNNQQMEQISAKLDQIIDLLSKNQAKPKVEEVILEASSDAKAVADKPAKTAAKKITTKKKAPEVEIPAEDSTE